MRRNDMSVLQGRFLGLALGFENFKWLCISIFHLCPFRQSLWFLDDSKASCSRFGASYRRLGRGLEACWAVWEASWGLFRIYLKLLGASCRFSCGLEACWMQLGGILEAPSKHFGGVPGRLQRFFPGLGGDIAVVGQFWYIFIDVWDYFGFIFERNARHIQESISMWTLLKWAQESSHETQEKP